MRVGFACKYMGKDGKQPFPSRTVTASRLSLLQRDEQIEKLIEIGLHNIRSVHAMARMLAIRSEMKRMMRITSELLPLFTHKDFSAISRKYVLPAVEKPLRELGDFARLHRIRLSFHPGQFTVLASDRPEVVENSIRDLEYHTLIASLMGYGKKFQDFKINIHLSGKLGADGFRKNFKRLSPECRRMLTVENDELTSHVEDCLRLSDLCPVVLDIHHHWVMTNEYIQPNDPRVQLVIESWRGVRPTMHYSVSRPEFVPSDVFPDQNKLSVPKTKLRAHSDYFHNQLVNAWALSFDSFDIMCESKAKNLAVVDLLQRQKVCP